MANTGRTTHEPRKPEPRSALKAPALEFVALASLHGRKSASFPAGLLPLGCYVDDIPVQLALVPFDFI